MQDLFKVDVQIISLKEFLKLIPIRQVGQIKVYQYFTYAGSHTFMDFSPENESEEYSYRIKCTLLMSGEIKDIVLSTILENGTFIEEFKVPLQEFYEKIIVKHTELFGSGKYVVRLGSKKYAALDPNDFLIIQGKYGTGLCSLFNNRLLIHTMLPITKEEAVKHVEIIKASQPDDCSVLSQKDQEKLNCLFDQVKKYKLNNPWHPFKTIIFYLWSGDVESCSKSTTIRMKDDYWRHIIAYRLVT